MMLVRVRFGDAHMVPLVYNANCDCDIFLDYVQRRAVKDTEAFARERDAQLRAAQLETERAIAVRRGNNGEPTQAARSSRRISIPRSQRTATTRR